MFKKAFPEEEIFYSFTNDIVGRELVLDISAFQTNRVLRDVLIKEGPVFVYSVESHDRFIYFDGFKVQGLDAGDYMGTRWPKTENGKYWPVKILKYDYNVFENQFSFRLTDPTTSQVLKYTDFLKPGEAAWMSFNQNCIEPIAKRVDDTTIKIKDFGEDLNYQSIVLDLSEISLMELAIVLYRHNVNKIYRLDDDDVRYVYIDNYDLHVIEDIERDWPEDKDGEKYPCYYLLTDGWVDERIQTWSHKQYFAQFKGEEPVRVQTPLDGAINLITDNDKMWEAINHLKNQVDAMNERLSYIV